MQLYGTFINHDSVLTHVIEAERKRLALIETVARSVREAVDTESIGRTAMIP